MTRRISAVAALILAVAVLMAGSVRGDRADYVGAERCGRCHAEALSVWQKSAHARAALRLGARPKRQCLACHTTGEAPAGRPFFAGVHCEACHGPGAAYATEDIMRNPTLAGHLGLRDLSTAKLRAALCAECHRARTRLSPFDPEAAYRAIKHSQKP